MLDEVDRSRLLGDFKKWGLRLLRRALKSAQQYGVLCSATIYSNAEKG